jgi:hypothetical protein
VRADVKIRIETRDEGHCCSFRCPHLGNVENSSPGLEYACQLFNVILTVSIGGRAPVRNRICLQQELVPAGVKPKQPKADATTVWDRLLKKDLV